MPSDTKDEMIVKVPAELTFSVAICTRNRASSLAKTLKSIVAAANTITEMWELIIIDNGSTDDTRTTISMFEDKLPMRYIVEPSPGLSNARNRAISAAVGNYIIWTDDDVIVDIDWLHVYCNGFRKYPEYVVFGGSANPEYESPTTSWFVRCETELASLLAIRDNPRWHEIIAPDTPYGLNFAIKTSEQRKYRYNPNLGVAPGRRRGGEETAVILALLASGAKGVWLWGAKVTHVIPSSRQSARYIWDFYRAVGYDYPVIDINNCKHNRYLIYIELLVKIFRCWISWIVMRILGNEKWVGSYIIMARTFGTIDRRADIRAAHIDKSEAS